jgi:uncharacterized membrane protein
MARPDVVSSISQRVTRTFFAGLFAILPLALTLLVIGWVTQYLHDLAGPQSTFGRVLRSIGMTVTACEITAYAFGAAGALLLVYGLGVLIEYGIGRHWNSVMDRTMRRIPILRTLYDASKNLSNVFDTRSESLQGMTPVMCYFGNDRVVATPAFMPTPDLLRIGGNDYRLVIIPSAPVPFGGALLCVKADWVQPAECSFDELIGIYVSMGFSAAGCFAAGKTAVSEPASLQRDAL